MFEMTYNNDEEVLDGLMMYINENSRFHASRLSHWVSIRRRDVEGDNEPAYCYTLRFNRGVMSISDCDILFSADLWGFRDLLLYEDREVLHHHPVAPVLQKEIREIMELLKETKITWKPSQEEIDEAREEGHPVSGFSLSEGAVEPGLMTCYGFGGDVYWLNCLEAVVFPLLQPGLEIEFNPVNPLEVFIKATAANTCIVLSHPMHVEGESRPSVSQSRNYYTTPTAAGRGFRSLSKLNDVYSVIDRSGHDRIREMYRSLVYKG